MKLEYLTGTRINVDTDSLKAEIGTPVSYLLEVDIDKTGRGYFFPRSGTITNVHNRHVDFGNEDYHHFSTIREISKTNQKHTR